RRDLSQKRLRETYARGKKHSFIVVAEGAGDAQQVAQELAVRTGQEAKWVVLGHTQRGGPPSAHDRIMAALFASKAVELLTKRQTNTMVALHRGSVQAVPLPNVIQSKKKSPLKWQDLAEILAR
ncbi:MAG: 6-phosphofructokinase, partial [Thermaerobacter sp.]|nr:6-phosphofructokinase [Thermaerobacter sp.]